MESKRKNKQMKKIVRMMNEAEECAWVLAELKSVLGYQGTFISLRLAGTVVSL